jgi:integrase
MATIRKRQRKWEVQVRRAGQRATSRSFHIRKDAEAWARQMEVRADRADLPADPKTMRRIKLGDLVERYRDSVSIHKRSHDKERFFLNTLISHAISRKTLSELRAEDFAGYRDERLKHIQPASLKRELTPIRHMFKIARDEWHIPINNSPLDKLQLKAPDQRRERRLRPGELERLMKAARSCNNLFVAPIILLAIETGMRRGELLAIRQSKIDFERQTIQIVETKNGHSRTIPLTNSATAILHDHASRTDERLFPVSANAFRLAWERLRVRAAITDLRFHDGHCVIQIRPLGVETGQYPPPGTGRNRPPGKSN